MMKSNHRRQDIIDRVSSRLGQPGEGATGAAVTPAEAGEANGRSWPQVALAASLMVGFLAIPLVILLAILSR